MKPPLRNSSGIYLFKNKLNGKAYVGQSKKVLTRKKQHERGDTKNSRRFHNAMKKHGVEIFNFEVLEYCSAELLDEREAYWINKLNTLYPKGYNLTSGGDAFKQHHEETKKKMSANQKLRIQQGTHLFASRAFQNTQAAKQVELAKQGKHSSQQPEFKIKKKQTIAKKIEETGFYFKHSTSTIERFRMTQKSLYEVGNGRFQDPVLIERNRLLVKQRLEAGTHHTQQAQWTEKAKKAAQKQMKRIITVIRGNDGSTYELTFPSIHEASRQLEADRRHLINLSNKKKPLLAIQCNQGRVINVAPEGQATWKLTDLKKMPDSAFTKKKSVTVTIQSHGGEIITRRFDSQRSACRELDAQHRALRYMIKGEKYKSTGCNLGRIIEVTEN
jgi:group I intron endonuclease